MSTYSGSVKSPWIFFVITFIISWTIWLPGMLQGLTLIDLGLGLSELTILNVVGGFGPTVTGLLLYYREAGRDGLRDLLKRGVDVRRIGRVWWLPLFLLLPAIDATALVLGIVTGDTIPQLTTLSQPLLIPLIFIVAMLPISNAFREEFGWRGYAQDSLQNRWSALISSIIIGLFWGSWHQPLRFFPWLGAIYANLPVWIQLSNSIALSIIMTWIYNNTSKSVLSAIVFHAVLNPSASIFPFAETTLGLYFNWTFLLITAFIIVLFAGHRDMIRHKEQPARQ